MPAEGSAGERRRAPLLLPPRSIPSALGNPGPRHRAVVALPPGPRRLTDDNELTRFHIPPGRPRRRPRGLPRLADARRILVVRLDFVGDWIVTTPLLDALRAAAPRAEITALVLDRAFDFADADPAVDRVVALSWARGRCLGVGSSSASAVAGFVGDYRRRRFDLALVPRWDVDFNGATQVAWGSGAPRIVGFAERSTPMKAAANRGDDRFYTDLVDDRRVLHEAARQMTLLRAFGLPDRAPGAVRAATTAGDRATAGRFMRRFRRPVLALAPFVDQGRRTLPRDLLIPLVQRIVATFDLDIAVIAAPVHERQARALARELGPGAVSLPAGGLRVAAAVIARCAAALCMDSGPAHMAAGVGTPVAVVSCHPVGGSDAHPQAPVRFAPQGGPDRVLVLRPPRPLPPCRDGCTRETAHCIALVDMDVAWPLLAPFLRAALERRAG